MKIEDVKNTQTEFRKNKLLSVRTTPHIVSWLKANQISATKIFNCAIKELGYKA